MKKEKKKKLGGRTGLFQLILHGHSSSLKKVKTGTLARSEATIKEKEYILPFLQVPSARFLL